jgi:transcriptional regulator with XRE-family HTH domain
MPRRTRLTRAAARLNGRQNAAETAMALAAQLRAARKRRGLSLGELGAKVDLTGARLSQILNGKGAGCALDVWFALGEALDLPFKVEFGRDRIEEPLDAGHLAIQELCLGLGRLTSRVRKFELPTKPDNPSYSIDVCLRDDVSRTLVIEECWNSFGNINASVRSTRRKVAEAQELAIAIGGESGPYAVAACWIVRDTRRNRELLRRYPQVFASAFPASSAAWVKVLTNAGVQPPTELGLVWCDLRVTRIFAWRQPSTIANGG